MTIWLKSVRDFVAFIVLDALALVGDWKDER